VRQEFLGPARTRFRTPSTIVFDTDGDPPGQIGGTGHYNSPHGFRGDFVTTGNATVNTIDATFDGIDCDDGSGVPLPFSDRIRVTKQAPSGSESQECAKAKIDACGIGRGETRHPRWERCRAL